MIRQTLGQIIRFFAFIIVLFFIVSVNSSCENTDCQGCYDEAPWSTPGSNICYPDEDMCEDSEPEKCQKCT